MTEPWSVIWFLQTPAVIKSALSVWALTMCVGGWRLFSKSSSSPIAGVVFWGAVGLFALAAIFMSEAGVFLPPKLDSASGAAG